MIKNSVYNNYKNLDDKKFKLELERKLLEEYNEVLEASSSEERLE